jgi:hypothetical protein
MIIKKSYLLTLCCWLGFIFALDAQVFFGLRAGVISTRIDKNPIQLIPEIGQNFLEIGINNARTGFQGGAVIQARMGGFLLQPEILFSTVKYEYLLDGGLSAQDPLFEQSIQSERYQHLDIPFLLGFKLGPLRLQAGPEAHIHLSRSSDLLNYNFYRENIDKFTFGWLGGLGLDVWNLMFDVRYEGNLNRLGSSFAVGNAEFRFDNRPARWVFSLGVLFN